MIYYIQQVKFSVLHDLFKVIVMDLLEKSNINIHICTSNIAEPHSHKYLELAYVLYGSAVHKFNETDEEIISKGDYFIIDYRTVHSYQSINNCDFAVINCLFLPQLVDKSLAYCKDFQTLLRHYLIQINSNNFQLNLANHIFHDENGKILSILQEMLTEYEQKDISWNEMLRTKMIDLLILTARKISHIEPQDVVSVIIAKIHKNYNQNLTLKDIADNINYSLPYISKLFKEKTGITFRLYLQKTRIEEACRLLSNTDEKIFSISKMVGYSDVDFFSKIFKEHMGITPQQFRVCLKITPTV